MKKFIYAFIFTIGFYQAKSQINNLDTISWLNNNVVSLDENYLRNLSLDLDKNKVVGLGEASHGTEEFYREKNQIIKHLIKNNNYTKIGIEFSDSHIEPINQYISTGKGDLKTMMQDFRLYNVQALYDLFEWIKNYNNSVQEKIEVFGIDNNDFTDPFIRDSLMAINVFAKQIQSNAKIIVWGHNLHLAKDTLLGYKALGYYLSKQYHNGYFNIAFDTYQGSVNTIMVYQDETTELSKNTLELPLNNFSALFSKVKYDKFYICFNKDNPFMGLKNTITNIWADWRAPFTILTRFPSDFNALIFIKNTTASQILK